MTETINLSNTTFSNNDEYFMILTLLAAQRSKDPCTQVGACIIDKSNNLIGLGYNGMPRGCHDDMIPWCKRSENPIDNKHLYVCHAELNAIANSKTSVNGCTLYVTLFPCNECAKLIIQHGIKKVVYLFDKHHDKFSTAASRMMLQYAKVEYLQFVFTTKRLVIDLPNVERSREIDGLVEEIKEIKLS